MKSTYRYLLLATTLLAFHRPASSDDIDLFVRANPASDAPNVLLVIDNASNFNANAAGETCVIEGTATALSGTVGGIEQCALYTVISSLEADSVRIGIMVNNDSSVYDHLGVQCTRYVASRPGGCLVYPLKLMTTSNKAELLAWIRSWTTSAGDTTRIDGSNKATGGSMQEAWAYFKGRTGVSGRPYADIAPPSACNNYIIYIGNSYNSSGSPGDQTGSAGPKEALEGTNPVALKNAFPPATTAQKTPITRTITTSCGTATLGSPHENNGYYADEWSRYMNPEGITTYTIGVLGPSCQAAYAATLDSTATVGGGKYFPTNNFAELVAALQAALSEMLSTNSVFASVSLPISVNTEGTYLNQVYIGMFRPDADALPRWTGNLKQYRLGLVSGELKLIDARTIPQPAISSADTGFIAACAQSYWTPGTTDAYWVPFAEANCTGYAAASNFPDGNVVEKGAQGYVLRASTPASRNLMTCNSSCSSSLADFVDGNSAITKTLLGDAAMTDAERTSLIEWARGLNNAFDETYVAATAMRPSVHGDVVHSRPVAVNYAAPTDTPSKIVVFYGGNDGVLRAVNGNRTADIGSVGAGEEMWSFIAPEFYSQIDVLRDNDTTIDFEGNTATEQVPKPYGFDGALTIHSPTPTVPGSDKWLYATMRRGGRMVYAFDVTGLADDPDSPTLKWRFGCPNLGDDTGCTTGATGMGQSWSTSKLMKTTFSSGDPLLIMGGGYDPCEDSDPHSCTSTSKGSHVYVFDADDGDLLATLDTDRPVVADVSVVADRVTGLAKWAYVVDMGGNIYRISGTDANTPFGATDPDLWTITKIAALGCSGTAPCTENRKFMFAPDIVDDSGVLVLLVGSGDREKPLRDYTSAYGTANYFFMVKDVPTTTTWLSDETDECGSAVMCLDSLLLIDSSADPDPADLADKKGWYLALHRHEQVVTSAITVFGATTFSTHTPTVPADGACTSDLGTARVYNVRFANAAPSRSPYTDRWLEVDGGGLPPSPVAGMVRLDDGRIVPFIIGADPDSPLEGGEPIAPTLTTLPKSITYWYVEK